MEFLTSIINFLNSIIWSVYVLVPLLLGTGLYFTIKTRGLQIRMIPEMFRSIDEEGIENEDGVSSFEAFTVGLATRIGTGNLAGVAIAIVTGGPGAVFWMWLVAILGSVSAFVESTLAQVYKVRDEETSFRGGPAYYMRDGLKKPKMGTFFAIMITICFGLIFNAVSTSTIANAAVNGLGITENVDVFNAALGLFLATLAGYIILGGTKKIADFTAKMVPFMAFLYIGLAIIVLIVRADQIPVVFHMIMSNAFTANAAFGGAIGITVVQGVKRGLFSNEAGMGSAPNAAASATTNHPVRQGLIQSLGVYVDTLVICSATAFIILVSGIPLDPSATDGISVTMNALGAVLGQWAMYYLLAAIFFFAFSTVIGCYYYAQANLEYLGASERVIFIFKFVVMALIVWGACVSSEVIWALSDLALGAMALVNIIAILMLRKKAFVVLKDFEEQRKAGVLPVFDSSKYEEFKELEIWDQSKNN